MSRNVLLPNKFKKPGWVILTLSLVAGIGLAIFPNEPAWLNAPMLHLFNAEAPNGFSDISTNNILDELIGVFMIIGASLVAFSKEKTEDEGVTQLRHDCLLWAVMVNYAVLFLALIFIFDHAFLKVLLYNMFTLILIFIIRFNFLLYTKIKPA